MSLIAAGDALPLVVIVVASLVGIFYHRFHDNLLQRMGMAGMAFGAVLKLLADLQVASAHAGVRLLVYGIALYGAGCLVKLAQARFHK